MRLVAVAAGERERRPALLVGGADAFHRMAKAQDVGDRLGPQPYLGTEALDEGLAAQGEVATERADRARAVARLQAGQRPGNVGRHGASQAQPLEQEAVHEVEAPPPARRVAELVR